MKFLMLTILTLFCSSSMAFSSFYDESECEKNNVVTIDVTITEDRFEPRIIYLQEKDKVCLFVKALDFPVSLTIDRLPVMVTAQTGKTAFAYFRVEGPGEYAIKCNGGCAEGVRPKIIVQTREEFEKFQEEKYREKSERYRKKVGDDQYQRHYRPRDY